MFIRFSTVTLGREFPDEARNPRGFAIKLYTMEGNYDIVGLNFVREPQSQPDLSITDPNSLYSSVVTLFRVLMLFAPNIATQRTSFLTRMRYSIC